ncbi:uncharacterized protein ACWYII_040948 [Salvelinus alpinus]
MVTGVRYNGQPGDLERRRGSIRDSSPSSTRIYSQRTPTKGTIPGTRSRLVTSAEAREPVMPDEAREPEEPIESCEPGEPAEASSVVPAAASGPNVTYQHKKHSLMLRFGTIGL